MVFHLPLGSCPNGEMLKMKEANVSPRLLVAFAGPGHGGSPGIGSREFHVRTGQEGVSRGWHTDTGRRRGPGCPLYPFYRMMTP
jgi:hypothetical protein